MQKMKDSCIPWIGPIPEDWALKKLKFCANLRVEKVVADNSEELQYVGLEHVEPQSGRLVSDYEPILDFSGDTVRYHKDDVLFGKLRPYLAKAYKADGVGKCSSEFFVMTPAAVSSEFLTYLVLSKGFVDAVNGSTFGVKMPRAEWEFVGNMKIPLPSLRLQQIIASFLSCRCGQIDSVIAAKEKTNEALKAYRQSVIYEAVTKGLDPAAPLKDSNIPWIGKIPQSWRLERLKYHAPCFENGNLAIAQDLWRGVGFGSTEISVVRCSGALLSRYLYYFFQNSKFVEKGVSEMYGVAGLKRLPSSFLIESGYPVPPGAVQSEIVEYLDEKCGQIDAVLAANESIVKKLREYRQSLIYEAVTGKIACA